MAQIPVAEGLFVETERGPRLRAARCRACGELHFPGGSDCPFCGSESCEVEEIGALGKLHAGTVVRTAPPGYSGPVPYGFGLVDLDEGLRVVSALEITDDEELVEGLRLRLVLRTVGRGDDGKDLVAWSYQPENP